jgi:hypothetical protein
MYRLGQVVKVYSLQSDNGGGFLNGVEGIVSRDEDENGIVYVAVPRKIGMESKIDPHYKVFAEQLLLWNEKPDVVEAFAAGEKVHLYSAQGWWDAEWPRGYIATVREDQCGRSVILYHPTDSEDRIEVFPQQLRRVELQSDALSEFAKLIERLKNV